MATPYIGAGSVVGFGEESTNGTGVARSVWAECVRAVVTHKKRYEARPVLQHAGGKLGEEGSAAMSEMAELEIEVLVTYRSIGLLFKHSFGALATAGSGPYTHTFTLGALPISATPGLTVEVIRGNSGDRDLMVGCIVQSMRIRWSAGDYCRAVVRLIGRTSSRDTAGSPSYPSNLEPVVPGQFTSLSWNSSTVWEINSFDLALERNMDRRQVLGALTTGIPVATSKPTAMLTVDGQYVNDTPYDGHIAGTQSDAVITLAGNGNSAIVWTLNDAIAVEHDDGGLSTAGIVSARTVFKGHANSSDDVLKAVITNDDSSGIAA